MTRPYIVECEITNGCNLRCRHCDVVEGNSSDFIFYVGEALNGDPCTAGEEHFSILCDGTVVPCGHFSLPSRCAECQIYEKGCFGGCGASSMIFAGRIDLPDPVICRYKREFGTTS